MTHTAGPWLIKEDAHYAEGLPLTIVSAPTGDGICGVAGGDPFGEDGGVTDETRDNASLIIAAPNLLATLREVTRSTRLSWHSEPELLFRVLALLSKAEGDR